MTKKSGGDQLTIELDVKFYSYPERESLGSVSRSAGVSGTSADSTQEDDLITRVSTEAMAEFARMAAQID